MDRISIDHLSVFGLPPVELVGLAADLGCRHVSMALSPITSFNPHGYPSFSLKTDRALRRETLAAMRDRDVAISLGSGFLLSAETDVAAFAEMLEIMTELAIPRINSVSFDDDTNRGFDKLAQLAELAASFGMETTLEILPGLLACDLPSGLAAVHHVGRPDFKLLIDTMHVVRAGATPSEVAQLPAELVGYIQLCDAPLVPIDPDYGHEVTFDRLVPGEGELPLLELLAALPRDRIVGLEIPMGPQAEAGIGPCERLRPCVDAARQLLSQIDAAA